MANPIWRARDDWCIGTHLPTPQEDCIAIDWSPVRSPFEHVRIHKYTCACQAVFYELCQSGGLFFIRRSRRVGDEIRMEESPRLIGARSHDEWDALLAGESH
jgi:hypothetical protein